MAKKKSKLSTPEWILEGYDSPEAFAKAKGVNTKKKAGKTFKVRECPECGSDEVGVLIGTTTGEWECRKCKWSGVGVKEKEMSEEEFMIYLDEKGEEVA